MAVASYGHNRLSSATQNFEPDLNYGASNVSATIETAAERLLELGDAPSKQVASSLPGSPVEPAKARPGLKNKRTNTMNGPLYMQVSQKKRNFMPVQLPKRKDESLWRSFMTWLVENQIGLSLNLVALLFLAHVCIPRARPTTRKFFHLSYYNPSTGRYAAGSDDFLVVAFYIVVLVGLRAIAMEYMLAPLGKWLCLQKRTKLTRFSEQAWVFLWYIFASSAGVYLLITSPFGNDLKASMSVWPQRDVDGLLKAYLLLQLASWLHQIFILHIEQRRKDHIQMLAHHIVAVWLIVACYLWHLPHIGFMIHITMDSVDMMLPLAKCLKYTGYNFSCDVVFAMFTLSWFFTRHVIYIKLCWSIYENLPKVLPLGCYHGPATDLRGPEPLPESYSYRWSLLEPFYNQSGTLCRPHGLEWFFLVPLIILQVLLLSWFSMIISVVIRVVQGHRVEDARSEDEGDEDEEEMEVETEFIAPPLEEEVGVEALDLKAWGRRASVKRHASSSGVSFPGHSDRKELLGRIGCEKQVE